MNTIKASTRAYETWLKAQIGPDFVKAGLAEKHRKMHDGPFSFLRATYWRWAETILEICPELADAPEILAIGDTHIENFGTWRDVEGRLIWGANDFDEAAVMPYPLDLVRLATSALLAREDGPTASVICTALLEGYTQGLAAPAPLVLERDYKWLRKAIVQPEPERAAFWEKIDALAPTAIPPRYENALRAVMPDPATPLVMSPRTAGTGSLGRPRFVASGTWRGGPVLREAKAIVVSAWSLRHAPGTTTIRVGEIAAGRCRAPDPHYQVSNGIVVRRLSPNSRKIEVKDAADELLFPRMLKLMGREIANCHANDPAVLPMIQEDLARRGGDWLRQAAKVAAQSVAREQAAFA
ncbi:DUF2252 family protein [Bosea vaviloviae]|uniref:DUF2252 domain-containing protein n=1 Tax=Bosea vaviloviae TaxID=1526658 RepID=A0A1D7U7Q0_9HYPH|nr:DUF2252 family protein [Bosea vaviloviae]AOO83398.1 hypothetical protein BHK69_25790 [Bosea vaviloviae]